MAAHCLLEASDSPLSASLVDVTAGIEEVGAIEVEDLSGRLEVVEDSRVVGTSVGSGNDPVSGIGDSVGATWLVVVDVSSVVVVDSIDEVVVCEVVSSLVVVSAIEEVVVDAAVT